MCGIPIVWNVVVGLLSRELVNMFNHKHRKEGKEMMIT